MKILFTTILALFLIPFTTFASDVEIDSKDGKHSSAPKSKTTHENSTDDDDYPPEGNDGER